MIICFAKMERVLLGKLSCTFSESSELLIYFSTEFESQALRQQELENFAMEQIAECG